MRCVSGVAHGEWRGADLRRRERPYRYGFLRLETTLLNGSSSYVEFAGSYYVNPLEDDLQRTAFHLMCWLPRGL